MGVVGISAIGAGDRSTDYPDEIVWTSVDAQPNTAAWALSPKAARELETMLNGGQKVTLRSITKSEQVPNKQEIVHAEIPGDGSTTQEVAIGGHLFEAYIKQGANDDNSGCALTLEIGRAYLKLIAEGKLPRPKRTINFQWVQEISGTNAWFNAHPDKQKVIIGDLNFDMEGIRLTQSRSYWVLQRTPDTFPSYINDIAQSMMEYIAEVSRERVRYRRVLVMAPRSRSNRPTEAKTLFTSKSTSTTAPAITSLTCSTVFLLSCSLPGRTCGITLRKTRRTSRIRRSTNVRRRWGRALWPLLHPERMRWQRGFSAKTSAAACREWASRTRKGWAIWPMRRTRRN